MSKRPWSNGLNEPPNTALHPAKRVADESASSAHNGHPLARISRNIKACTICRKHKIKCLMADSGPPCNRCQEKNLECVVSRNLQSILEEKTQLSEAMLADLTNLYAAVKEMRSSSGLPKLPPLQIAALQDGKSSDAYSPIPIEESYGPYGPSCDNSPKLSPDDDRLPSAPIYSLYTLTKMRALRSPDGDEAKQPQAIDDFISRGKLGVTEAERLFSLYKERLDGFIYSIGCRYSTLEELRRKSSILSAATLTVAAMHDPDANESYGICRAELRKLIEGSMLQRQADRDYFRALCIATYWLSDLSWTLSGHAIRRATECNIHNSYSHAAQEKSEEAIDCARIWSILYICDQHLATLYNRPAIIQGDSSTQDWEAFLAIPSTTSQDERLMSQVELMGILKTIRQLFGPDTGESVPRAYINQLGHYNRQLDRWIAKWTTRLPEQHPGIGGFPRKGLQLHYHFAQLYLYSHIFRGQSSPLPNYLLDPALIAVNAASTIMEFLLTDPDVSASIVGMPSYLLSMIAFTCIFVVKIAHKYKDDSLLKLEDAQNQISRLINWIRSLATGNWHLANLMVGGLEKLAKFVEQSGNIGYEQNGDIGSLNTAVHRSDNNGALAHFTQLDGAMTMPRVDGNPHPALDTTFGLSPIYGFDPTWLDVEALRDSVHMYPTAGSLP